MYVAVSRVCRWPYLVAEHNKTTAQIIKISHTRFSVGSCCRCQGLPGAAQGLLESAMELNGTLATEYKKQTQNEIKSWHPRELCSYFNFCFAFDYFAASSSSTLCWHSLSHVNYATTYAQLPRLVPFCQMWAACPSQAKDLDSLKISWYDLYNFWFMMSAPLAAPARSSIEPLCQRSFRRQAMSPYLSPHRTGHQEFQICIRFLQLLPGSVAYKAGLARAEKLRAEAVNRAKCRA